MAPDGLSTRHIPEPMPDGRARHHPAIAHFRSRTGPVFPMIYKALRHPEHMTRECRGCAVCCKLFLINLTDEEYRSGRYRTQLEACGFIDGSGRARAAGANIVRQKRDGSCIYLKGGRCSIHGTRPRSCRGFFCSSRSGKFSGMIADIEQRRGSPVAGRMKIKKW